MRPILYAVIAAALMLGPVLRPAFDTAIAADRPIPNVEARWPGTIDWIDLAADSVVINDMQYVLPKNVRVYTGDKRETTRSALKQGMKLSFSFSRAGPQPTITEMWLETR